MILLGGSSMHKGGSGWQAARAIGCLPGAHRPPRRAGRRLRAAPRRGEPRPGARRHHRCPSAGRRATYVPNQMPRVTEALVDGPRPRAAPLRHRHAVLVRRRGAGGRGPRARRPRGEPRPLPERHRAAVRRRRPAGDLVARGARLQEHEHAPLPHAEGAGAARRDAARRRGSSGSWPAGSASTDFYPWATDEGPLDAILDHPATGHATVAALRAEGGIRALRISHVGHPTHAYATPSGKVELYSARAAALGLPPLAGPRARARVAVSARVPPGPHAHPVPRLLRPRPGAADARPPRPRAASLDRAGRRGRARPRRRRGDPRVQRARALRAPGRT